jgi:GNAT superfamily N-acetyltransferase
MLIRDPAPADESAWKRLWAGYNAFYRVSIPDAVTDHTWQRILDPASAIFARLAQGEGEAEGDVIGFTLSVLHEGTWTSRPVCYLEDLFVDPAHRRQGVARQLIADLIARARNHCWSRLYWHTRQDNPARQLYDEFARADDFVRYRLVVEP